MSAIQRVVSVLVSPGKTFREIAEKPTWAIPLVVLLLCAGTTSWVVLQRIDAGAQQQLMRERLEDRGMSGQELDRAVTQGSAVYKRLRPVLPVIGVVFAVAAYLVMTLVLWGAFSLGGGELSFVKAFSTTLHGLMPQAVQALVAIPVVLSRQTIDPATAESGSLLASNLAVFAPEGAALWLRTLLSSFDFFTIWSVVLLIIGFGVTARVSKGTSIAVVVGCWLVWIAVRTGWVALVG